MENVTMRSSSFGLRRVSRSRPTQRPRRRLMLEELETRLAPVVTFTQTSLATDNPTVLKNLGMSPAARTDTNLVNPWGITLGTNSGFWVAENGTGMAESFDGTGKSVQTAITIPAPGGTGTSAPTGVATN